MIRRLLSFAVLAAAICDSAAARDWYLDGVGYQPNQYQVRVTTWMGAEPHTVPTVGGAGVTSVTVGSVDLDAVSVAVGTMAAGAIVKDGMIAVPAFGADAGSPSMAPTFYATSGDDAGSYRTFILSGGYPAPSNSRIAPYGSTGVVQLRAYLSGVYAGRILAVIENGAGTWSVTAHSSAQPYMVSGTTGSPSNYDGTNETVVCEVVLEPYDASVFGGSSADLIEQLELANDHLAAIRTYTGGIYESTSLLPALIGTSNTTLGSIDSRLGTLNTTQTSALNQLNLTRAATQGLSTRMQELIDAMGLVSGANVTLVDDIAAIKQILHYELVLGDEVPLASRIRTISLELIAFREQFGEFFEFMQTDFAADVPSSGPIDGAEDVAQEAFSSLDRSDFDPRESLGITNPLDHWSGFRGESMPHVAPTLSVEIPDLNIPGLGSSGAGVGNRTIVVDFAPVESFAAIMRAMQVFFATLWGMGRVWSELRRI